MRIKKNLLVFCFVSFPVIHQCLALVSEQHTHINARVCAAHIINVDSFQIVVSVLLFSADTPGTICGLICFQVCVRFSSAKLTYHRWLPQLLIPFNQAQPLLSEKACLQLAGQSDQPVCCR